MPILAFFLLLLPLLATAPAWSQPTVTGLRFGVDAPRTRVVLDLDQPIRYTLHALADPDRLVLDLGPVDWRLQEGPRPRGLARGHVIEVGGDGRPFVRLSETLFHPQGGGQKADRGTVGGRAVTHVAHADGGEVNHYLDSTDGLSDGDGVEMVVEAEWRQLNARWHTAGHLIAAVVEKLFPAVQGVAGHHWPGDRIAVRLGRA